MLQKSCPKVRVAWAIFIIISPAKKLPSQCSHFTIVVLTQENGWEKKRSHKICFIDLYKVYNILKNFKVTLFEIKAFGPKTQLLGKIINQWIWFFELNLTENLELKLPKKVNFQPQNWSKLTFSIFSKNPIRVKI